MFSLTETYLFSYLSLLLYLLYVKGSTSHLTAQIIDLHSYYAEYIFSNKFYFQHKKTYHMKLERAS